MPRVSRALFLDETKGTEAIYCTSQLTIIDDRSSNQNDTNLEPPVTVTITVLGGVGTASSSASATAAGTYVPLAPTICCVSRHAMSFGQHLLHIYV